MPIGSLFPSTAPNTGRRDRSARGARTLDTTVVSFFGNALSPVNQSSIFDCYKQLKGVLGNKHDSLRSLAPTLRRQLSTQENKEWVGARKDDSRLIAAQFVSFPPRNAQFWGSTMILHPPGSWSEPQLCDPSSVAVPAVARLKDNAIEGGVCYMQSARFPVGSTGGVVD